MSQTAPSPTPGRYDVDLFVIGGGSGGVRAARIAAGEYGARVALAEESRMGGTCVIRGCVPKKFMVMASEVSHALEIAEGYGWSFDNAKFDWPTFLEAKDVEIARLSGIYAANLGKAGVDLIHGRAVLKDAHTVEMVGKNRSLTAEKILIATGGHPAMPAGLTGGELAVSSNEVFHLAEQPKRVLIVGAGYIAVEFAGVFAGLGSHVTLVYRGDKILRGFDEDLRDHLTAEYTAKGIALVPGEVLSAIEKTGDGLTVSFANGHAPVETDLVLMATGRVPNTAGLGLDKVGIVCGANGAIPVDADSRTSVPSIYAVGDVTDRLNLTPVAIREGHAFADTLFGGKPWRADHATVPTAVFSEPEMGTVGLTETEALATGRAVDIYRAAFRPMKNTLSGRQSRMLMKLVVDGETDRVLGVHICGPEAGEMIQLAGIAVKMGATKADFDGTMAVHPTAAEELVTMRTVTVRHPARQVA